jgi:hypothetical protein
MIGVWRIRCKLPGCGIHLTPRLTEDVCLFYGQTRIHRRRAGAAMPHGWELAVRVG